MRPQRKVPTLGHNGLAALDQPVVTEPDHHNVKKLQLWTFCGSPCPTSSMTNMIRTLSSPNERIVYTLAKTSESPDPRASAGELVAARGELP